LWEKAYNSLLANDQEQPCRNFNTILLIMPYLLFFFFYFRAAGVPVDFEVVNIDPTSESDEDLQYAITSIKRNGVGIKG